MATLDRYGNLHGANGQFASQARPTVGFDLRADLFVSVVGGYDTCDRCGRTEASVAYYDAAGDHLCIGCADAAERNGEDL